MSAETLSRVRLIVLAVAGFVCAAYSLLAFLGDTPQPFSPWAPGAAGLSAAAIIWASAFAAGRRNTQIAMDELYRLEWGQAVQFSYWFGIVLFIFGAIAVSRGWIGQSTAIASLGTAYGASPMLAFTIINLRG